MHSTLHRAFYLFRGLHGVPGVKIHKSVFVCFPINPVTLVERERKQKCVLLLRGSATVQVNHLCFTPLGCLISGYEGFALGVIIFHLGCPGLLHL